jgi:beta-lactamase class A
MLGLMRAILLGKALSETSRRQLETWLVEAKIGADRIPAGLPAGWRVGHKTGSGPRGETNDIAVAWHAESGSAVLIASYYAGSDAPLAQRSSVLAEVGRVVAKYAGQKEP